MKISFEKLKLEHKELIYSWLEQDYIKEFWDNSLEHKQDIEIFINGRNVKSPYFNGAINFDYWIAKFDDDYFAFLMTSEIDKEKCIKENSPYIQYLSNKNYTYSIDFLIGNKKYLGKGLSSITLQKFIEFFQANINNLADTFLIDPEKDNVKAIKSYEKAGFIKKESFNFNEGYSVNRENVLMVNNIPIVPKVFEVNEGYYQIVQNLARFYVYDMTKYCGYIEDWECPEDGLFECINLKSYFIEDDRKAFIIKVQNELAGFALVNKVGVSSKLDWNMGEFFITSKFQNRGISKIVANKIFKQLKGNWEVACIPENKGAIKFWENVIREVDSDYLKETHIIQEPKPHNMIIYKFVL